MRDKERLNRVVHHCGNAGVGPHVFGCFDHIDDGVDGEDDAEDGDGGTDARHQGEGEEIAAHGHTGIADGREDGDDDPEQDGAQRDGRATVLHYEERGDEDEGCASVHVDGGADGQDEAGDVLADAETLLGRFHRDG